MPDYKKAFEAASLDLSTIMSLLGFTKYPGIDPMLRAITDLVLAKAEAQALREEVAALRARVVVPDEVMRALEDARKFVDAAFYVGLCEHSASRELYRDGTYTLAEHRDAKKNLKAAMESAEEAEIALLCSPLFVGESLYPASAEEMQARLNGKVVSEGLLRRACAEQPATCCMDDEAAWCKDRDAALRELRALLCEGEGGERCLN